MMWSRFWRRWWWLFALLVVDVVFVWWWMGPRRAGRAREPAGQAVHAVNSRPEVPQPPAIRPMEVGFPTAQRGLLRREDPAVYQATASGRIESAHYGSTRTRNVGGRILPSFHEGIDIAALERDRRNRALDPVRAIEDGRVGYANRTIGHSNYGLYVVLEHEDAVGTIYSLYAHLRSVSEDLRPGQKVKRGTVLGIMGNTPASIIPVVRSHLHFEVGMIQNRRFPAWTRAKDIRNLHGVHHGWNLTGIPPLALYESEDSVQTFSMLRYLQAAPVAFELAIRMQRPLDYFRRYPDLWEGEGPPSGVMVLSVSEGGVVVRGRPAAGEEAVGPFPRVLHADTEVLGRNGLRHVVQRGESWQLGSNGRRWLSILMQ